MDCINNTMKIQEIFEHRGRSVTVQGTYPEGFPTYIRDKETLKDKLAEIYGSTAFDGIPKLFAEHNIVIADNVRVSATYEELHKYREWDRNPSSGSTGTMSSDEYAELLQDIKQHGIQDASVLRMERLPNGNVLVKLGEGNHRLRIAGELGIRIPIRFGYVK